MMRVDYLSFLVSGRSLGSGELSWSNIRPYAEILTPICYPCRYLVLKVKVSVIGACGKPDFALYYYSLSCVTVSVAIVASGLTIFSIVWYCNNGLVS